MENEQEVKYEHENLLDKFIRNERKAKLWALISVLAFCTIATTVVVVAYKIKNSGDNNPVPAAVTETKEMVKTEQPGSPETRPETRTPKEPHKKQPDDKNKIDGLLAEIKWRTDSLNRLQIRYQDKVKELEGKTQEVNRYIALWQACLNTKNTSTTAQPISVMVYTVKVSKGAIDKLTELLKKSGAAKNGIKISFSAVPYYPKAQVPLKAIKQSPDTMSKLAVKKNILSARQQVPPQYYVGIKYFDSKFAGQAQIIANELNSSKAFTNWKYLNIAKGDVSASKTDIEIWLYDIDVNATIY